MVEYIKISDKMVGPKHPPLIIAEMSGNHNQSLTRALEIVEAAAEAGAHALKLQTYTADTMTLNLKEKDFSIQDSGSLWGGYSLYQLYQEAYTPWEWHKPIFDRCRELRLIPFSSPFDESAVDFLEKLDVPCYKIASFENTHLPLIRKVARTGKPILISTGMATLAELDETVDTVRKSGGQDLILLKCTSSYPSSPENSNLLTIPHMKNLFNCQMGLSDHTLGIGAALAAVSLGAVVIEKHFTLSRAEGGVDSAFSLEPGELRALVSESKRAWEALGDVRYGPTTGEDSSLKLRRSLYITKDMHKGDKLTPENVRIIRPGLGLPPKYYDLILGRELKSDANKGTPLTWDLI